MEEEKPPYRRTIYFDGSCPMCSSLIRRIAASKEGEQFDCVDSNSSHLPDGLSREAVDKKIHVVDESGKVNTSSDGIWKIAEAYPRLRWIARLGMLPGIRQLSRLGYAVVAHYRHLVFGPQARFFWLKSVLALALLSGLLLSPHLWLTTRSYPLVPVASFIPALPPPADIIFYGILLLILLAVLLSRYPRYLIVAFVAVAVIEVISDQSRLQPWFYQYVFMMFVLIWHNWKKDDPARSTIMLTLFRFVLASIYFWSGFQKLNLTFLNDTFPWFIEPMTNHLPDELKFLTSSFAIIVPLLEMRIGIGLLTRSFRTSSVILAILSHLFILACIGPFGHNWNSVVWPWNLAMILFVVILYWGDTGDSVLSFLPFKKSILYPAAFILFGITPALSFFNLWDSYLSSSLYSENTGRAVMIMSDSLKNRLPPDIRQYVTKDPTNKNVLEIFPWSIAELNVPPYPEERIYRSIASHFLPFAQKPNDLILVVQEKPKPFSETRMVKRLNATKLKGS